MLIEGTIFNVLGQAAPLVVAVVCLPFAVRGFGVDRFGVLALGWALLGVATQFDLGLGRASTRFTAQALAQGAAERVASIVGAALFGQLCLGVASGMLIVATAPFMAIGLFDLPDALQWEGVATLRLIGLAVPFVLLSGVLQGALVAHHRFGLVNLVTGLSGGGNYLLAALGVALGWSVPGVVGAMALVKVAAFYCLWRLTGRDVADLRWRALASPDFSALRELLVFGSWLAISSLVLPVLRQAERVAIPALVSIGALTFYSVPSDALGRVIIVPLAMAGALFPAFSRFDGDGGEAMTPLLTRPARYLLVILTPAMTAVALFAREILAFWMGADFAAAAAPAMRILAAFYFVNGFANLLRSAVQGTGRPDLKAKVDLFNTIWFLGLLVVLIPRFGIVGAAVARLVVAVTEVSLLVRLASRAAPRAFGFRRLAAILGRDVALASAFASLGVAAIAAASGTLEYLAFVAICGGYLAAIWFWVADPIDRRALATFGASLGLVRKPTRG